MRYPLVAVLLCFLTSPTTIFAQSQRLPLDLLDTADVDYSSYSSDLGGGIGGISDATSLGTGGGGDHFDDAFGISINGAGYSPSTGIFNGNSVALNTESFGQFDVAVDIKTDGPVLRQIVSVTNTGATGTAFVQWHNNTGNDGAQQTIATSNGDLAFDTSDRWIVTADNTTGTDNEVNAWILFGINGLAPSFVDTVDGSPSFGFAGEQGITAIYDLALEENETASLVFFAAVEGINQDGIEIARQFDDESSPFFQSLISDLNAAQRSTIRNFTASAIPEPSSIVVLGLGFLCTGFRRRR